MIFPTVKRGEVGRREGNEGGCLLLVIDGGG